MISSAATCKFPVELVRTCAPWTSARVRGRTLFQMARNGTKSGHLTRADVAPGALASAIGAARRQRRLLCRRPGPRGLPRSTRLPPPLATQPTSRPLSRRRPTNRLSSPRTHRRTNRLLTPRTSQPPTRPSTRLARRRPTRRKSRPHSHPPPTSPRTSRPTRPPIRRRAHQRVIPPWRRRLLPRDVRECVRVIDARVRGQTRSHPVNNGQRCRAASTPRRAAAAPFGLAHVRHAAIEAVRRTVLTVTSVIILKQERGTSHLTGASANP